jgi:uncharacterized membrane protein
MALHHLIIIALYDWLIDDWSYFKDTIGGQITLHIQVGWGYLSVFLLIRFISLPFIYKISQP